MLSTSSQDVQVIVYDTAAQAGKFPAGVPGFPIRDAQTHKVIGRTYRVANVVVFALHSAVPEALAAGRELAAKVPS
jgi:hypothetical protein